MEINRQKGFVYTLEAVIASTLILSVIITIIPEFEPDDQVSVVQERAYSGLQALDENGRLEENLSLTEIENSLDPYISPGYEFSARLTDLEKNSGTVNAPGQTELEVKNSSNLLLWLHPENSLNVTLNEVQLAEEVTSSQYLEVDSVTGGTLQVNGSGTVAYEQQWTDTEGDVADSQNVYSTSYMWKDNISQEVSVYIWQE